MNYSLVWNNVVAYSLQIGLLIGLAAFIPTLLRLKMPVAKLGFWHLLLAACLLLPLVQPWRQEAVTQVTIVSSSIITVASVTATARGTISSSELGLLLLGMGVLARFAWLAVGFWRLGRFRRNSRPLVPAPSWSVEADLRISEGTASPVTFGFRKPVILLPARFPDLDDATQDAILCHEVLHVRRRDWCFTVAEELVRAIFWFHPAIWWLLGEIQLSREQAVDRAVIEMTQSRDRYVDALLAIAGAPAQLDLALAPLFLRKRHLKQRVISILKEVRMSKRRVLSTLAAGFVLVAGACWFVTGAFPLAAEPQMVSDALGVSVDMRGAQLLHRSSVFYPREVAAKGIEGTVLVQVKLDENGVVSDAAALSGPEELRKSVLQSVLNWHFAKDEAGTTRQVGVTFQLTPEVRRMATESALPGVLRGAVISAPKFETQAAPAGKISQIAVMGLSDSTREQLMAQLQVHIGDAVTPESIVKLTQAVRQFDEHLTVNTTKRATGETVIRIAAPGANAMAAEPRPAPAGALTVDRDIQTVKLIRQPQPVYPPLAKQAQVTGLVQLNAIIGKDGHVRELAVIKGHPLLVNAAIQAVKDWVYQPTLLNNEPVEVQTTVDVNFTLSQ